MSDKPSSRGKKPVPGTSDAGERARQAMLKRSKKSDNTMMQYYLVIGAFIAICVAAVLYVLLNPKKSFAQMPVIDESQILVHNGQTGSNYQQGVNTFFTNWTLSNAKQLFQNSLSDTSNINPCKSKDDEEVMIPEKYDWREQFPNCTSPVFNQGNCSSTYASVPLSVASDRICMASKQKIALATQELISCDKSNYQCEGGYVNRVLNYGKRKGFIPEQCYPYNATKGECDEEHFETNECRTNNYVYRVIDYCLATEDKGIKMEILKNGPVVAQMTIYTDFLTYKEGLYHRTDDSFKFNGQHVVKIVGWDRQGEGADYWIVENSWGADWGEDGYFKVLASDKSTQIDFYALGVAIYPYSMAEYYAMQDQMGREEEVQSEQVNYANQGGEQVEVDLDSENAEDEEDA